MWHGWVGVVIGKVAVDALIQQIVHARQPGDDGGQHLARRAVAGVPGDLQGSPSRDTGEQAFDIGIEDGEAADAAPPARVVSRRRERAKRLDVGAEEGRLLPDQLEAVVARSEEHTSELQSLMRTS